MKANNIIRILAGLSFLIFCCPFFQLCSDDMMMKKQPETKEEFEQRKKDITVDAYQLSAFRKLDPHDDREISWMDTFFTSIIIFSTIILIKSFKSHSMSLSILCYLNLLLCIGFVIMAFISRLLEDFSQLKFGFYLFIINTIAIIAAAKKVEDAV